MDRSRSKDTDFTPSRFGRVEGLSVQGLDEVPLPTDPQPITDVLMFFTSNCNSRCVTCDIWKDTARQEFPFEKFVEMACEPILTGAQWALVGGEFTTYTNYIDVVEYLNRLHARYYLITNGILPRKIQNIYEHTGLTNLSVSLDAMGAKHDKIRGYDGNFRRVVELIEWVRKNHPETAVRVGFTMSEYNTRQDLMEVSNFCTIAGLELKLAVACDAGLYTSHGGDINVGKLELYEFEDLVSSDDKYLQLYRAWRRGWTPRCEGILQHVTVNYNGDVVVCPTLPVVMGNVLERRFDDVWNSEFSVKLRDGYSKTCNACWMSCIRKYDANKVSDGNVRHLKGVFDGRR